MQADSDVGKVGAAGPIAMGQSGSLLICRRTSRRGLNLVKTTQARRQNSF